MKRPTGCLINAALAIASLWGTFYLASCLDGVAGAMIRKSFEPGKMGMIFVPNQTEHFDMLDYQTVESTNSFGIRDREYPIERSDKFRIVAIGDSFTYGWGVNLEDVWCKQLEKRLLDQGLNVEVLNLGKPAAGPSEYAWIAETVLPLLQPDLVLVGVLVGDDLQQGPEVLTLRSITRAYFPNTLRLLQMRRTQPVTIAPVDTPVEETRRRAVFTAKELLEDMSDEQRGRFAQLPEEVQQAFHAGTLNPWMISHSTGSPDYFMNTLNIDGLDVQIGDMSRAFTRLRKAADKVGASTLVINIPEGFYVNREAFENVKRIGFHVEPDMLTTSVPDEALAVACEYAGLAPLSVTREFRDHIDEPGLYLKFDRHMAPKGNALLAEFITPAVSDAVRRHQAGEH